MARRITTEIFINESNIKHDFKYNYDKTIYIKSLKKVEIICPEHGSFFQTPNNHLNNGQGCPLCSKSKASDIKSFESLATLKYDSKYTYYQDFKNYKTKIKINCPLHGDFFKTPSDHIHQNQGCPECSRLLKINRSFKEMANLIHGDYIYADDYYNCKTKIKITCKKHGEFYQLPESHIHSKHGCPICNESKGEKTIRKILISNNLKFISQKKFEDCRYKRPLPFDFYLKEYNILIEYDGIQHLKPIKYFGGKEKFDEQVLKDNIKTEYCVKNNIKLLRINYKDNIEEKLLEYINKDLYGKRNW